MIQIFTTVLQLWRTKHIFEYSHSLIKYRWRDESWKKGRKGNFYWNLETLIGNLLSACSCRLCEPSQQNQRPSKSEPIKKKEASGDQRNVNKLNKYITAINMKMLLVLCWWKRKEKVYFSFCFFCWSNSLFNESIIICKRDRK